MNFQQLNKVSVIFAVVLAVIKAAYVLQGHAAPLGIPSYHFGVEVPLYRIKLPHKLGHFNRKHLGKQNLPEDILFFSQSVVFKKMGFKKKEFF